MIKTYHEAPKSMFKRVQNATDGDYALVHLLAQDEEYRALFDPTKRDVVLDNSVFELGEAFDPATFAYWVEELKPTWYIVPDVLEDACSTIGDFLDFVVSYPNLPGKRIGVVQGSCYYDVARCYEAIEPLCDKVAFSFDFSWWLDQFPVGKDVTVPTKWHSMMRGRIWMLNKLMEDGVINVNKQHHLLGVALPQELAYYSSKQLSGEMHWITSVDTSNPVVHGLKDVAYTPYGLEHKEGQKLCELIDATPDLFQQELIMENIKMFRRFCGGY